MKKTIRFGISNNLIELPLLFAIQQNQINHTFQIIESSPGENYQNLLKGDLDIAFVTPLDYATASLGAQIVDNFAIYNTVDSRSVLLFFKENLRSITDVAFDGRENHYYLFAKIVLQELYEISPRWHVVSPDRKFEEILDKFGCVFLAGEEALEKFLFFDNKIDLVEQWCNPERQFIHEILVVREGFQDLSLLEPLFLSIELGHRNLLKIAQHYARNRKVSWDFYFDLLNHSFQYYPTDVTWGSLEEYFKFLFYYGNIEYIPEIKFISIH